jgi:UDP-glucuronate 4-epimerase
MLIDALEGCPTRLPWGADFYRQYLFVEDAVESLLLALKAPAIKRQSYLVSGGTYLTIQEVAEIVRSVVPTAAPSSQHLLGSFHRIQERLSIGSHQSDFSTPHVSQFLGSHPQDGFPLKANVSVDDFPRPGQ